MFHFQNFPSIKNEIYSCTHSVASLFGCSITCWIDGNPNRFKWERNKQKNKENKIDKKYVERNDTGAKHAYFDCTVHTRAEKQVKLMFQTKVHSTAERQSISQTWENLCEAMNNICETNGEKSTRRQSVLSVVTFVCVWEFNHCYWNQIVNATTTIDTDADMYLFQVPTYYWAHTPRITLIISSCHPFGCRPRPSVHATHVDLFVVVVSSTAVIIIIFVSCNIPWDCSAIVLGLIDDCISFAMQSI